METCFKRHGLTLWRGLVRFAPAVVLLVASTSLAVALAVNRDRGVPESEVDNRPVQVASDGYVSSETCRSCHPSEYETWYGSFHRTMTQVATPETVRAEFDGVRVENTHGRPMLLERNDDEFWGRVR